MKLPLRYLALGLEIWLGVSAIVMGLYLHVSRQFARTTRSSEGYRRRR
jgi:hypothetical protein